MRRPTADLLALGEKYRLLNERVQELFIDWSDAAPARPIYVRGDMTRVPFLQLLHLDLAARHTPEQSLVVARKNLDCFEELAQVLFWQAVAECYPSQPALNRRPRVNAWRLRLAPNTWDEQGLFEAATTRRPLKSMQDNLTGLFSPQSARERIRYEFPYRALHWGNGFVYHHVIRTLRQLIFVGKPALWFRRLLVKDYRARPIERATTVHVNASTAHN